MRGSRILFLDFDGVLNSHAYMMSVPDAERGGIMGLDSKAVVRLNRLVSEVSAEVVVSSTWRHNRTTAQLQTLLRGYGFQGKVRGRTPRNFKKHTGELYSAKCRGHEIQAWLDTAEDYGIVVESFVILDDDSDMAHLSDRLVKTSFDEGLLDEHVDKAIELFLKPTPLIVVPKGE